MINETRQLAAIDLGSNSFHMVVARLQNNQLQTIDTIKEMVRLAAGLNTQNILSEKKREEALECLSRFGQRIKDLPAQNVAAVGTNTLRKAKNSADFLEAAEKALGYPINIVAGREEARLVYQGVAHSLAQTEDYRLVIDIGGGSTEFIIGKAYKPIMMESMNMGCVNFTQKWFDDGVVTESRIKRAIIGGRRKLEWISDEYQDHGWQECIGSSGTIKTLARILSENYDTHGQIDYEHLKKLADLFAQAGHIKHIILPGLSENRAPVIVGGLCVLMAAFEELQIESMQASEGALREGLLNDMFESSKGRDIRLNTVRDFEVRYHIDVAQSARICHSALQLFDQMENISPEHDTLRLLLLWAGKLHEIGLSISHTNYPEHSGYIVEQSDMPGFSRELQNTLGLMLRLQRGKLKTDLIEAFPRRLEGIEINILLLRIAIILERSRDWDASRKIKIKWEDKKIKLKFPKKYLKAHPLTRADLEQEIQESAKLGFDLMIK
ncbi:MAG: exopolyphosphatase [Gammaproteobacteria bacterium]|nr:exopolyphosphatase [Gammaproteobacteria bacterium]